MDAPAALQAGGRPRRKSISADDGPARGALADAPPSRPRRKSVVDPDASPFASEGGQSASKGRRKSTVDPAAAAATAAGRRSSSKGGATADIPPGKLRRKSTVDPGAAAAAAAAASGGRRSSSKEDDSKPKRKSVDKSASNSGAVAEPGVMRPRRKSIDAGPPSTKTSDPNCAAGANAPAKKMSDAKAPANLISKPTAEDIIAAVERLRAHLVERFSSKEAAFKALDTNGNGQLSVGEIRDACTRLRVPLQQITCMKDFNKFFIALAGRTDAELNFTMLMDAELTAEDLFMHMIDKPWSPQPKKDAAKKSVGEEAAKNAVPTPKDVYEAIDLFRKYCVNRFGTDRKAFQALDTNGNGLLSQGELTDAFKRLHIDVLAVTGMDHFRTIFKALDVDLSGELTFWELMIADSKLEAEKLAAAKKAAAAAAKALSMLPKDDVIDEPQPSVELSEKSTASLHDTSKEEPDETETEPYLLFRALLVKKFGSSKAAMRALDTNGNGLLSFGEIKFSLESLHIDPVAEIPGFNLKEVFHLLDVDVDSELSFFELFIMRNPHGQREKLRAQKKAQLVAAKKEAAERIARESHGDGGSPKSPKKAKVKVEKLDEIELLRRFLVNKFGSKEEAFAMLDADGSKMLSFGELRVSLERWDISLKVVVGENANLMRLFKRLDLDESGELNYYQLMEAPIGEKHKRHKDKKATISRIPDLDHFEELGQDEMTEEVRRMMKFASSAEVTELDLQWGHVGRAGAHRFASALASANVKRKVGILQLEGNYITSAGLTPLATAIEMYCQLQVLILSWNGIDNEGAERLGSLITLVPSLMELDIRHNHIGDHGAERLSRSITSSQDKSSLSLLNLECNLLGLFGISELKYACSGKVKLKLQGNLEESTSGCNMIKKSHLDGAIEAVQNSVANSSLQDSSLMSGEDPQDKLENQAATLRVPADVRHFTFCWNNVPRWPLQSNERQRLILQQARSAAQNIEREKHMALDEDADSTLDRSPTAFSQDVSPKTFSLPPTQAKNVRKLRKGAPGTACISVMLDRGISVDLMESLPAGDEWPPGVELEKSLLLSTQISRGKAKLPERPHSQGSSRVRIGSQALPERPHSQGASRASHGRVGAVSPAITATRALLHKSDQYGWLNKMMPPHTCHAVIPEW